MYITSHAHRLVAGLAYTESYNTTDIKTRQYYNTVLNRLSLPVKVAEPGRITKTFRERIAVDLQFSNLYQKHTDLNVAMAGHELGEANDIPQ